MVLSESSSLWQVLRERPAAVEPLEATGHPFWTELDLSVNGFCRLVGRDPSVWLRELQKIPVLKANSDWMDEPLYRIADYLVAEHTVFRETYLHGIDDILNHSNPTDRSDIDLLKLVHRDFEIFEKNLSEHMREEEDRIFPYILRLEACERNPGLGPVSKRVSLNDSIQSQAYEGERKLKQMIIHIREKVNAHSIKASTSAAIHKLSPLLKKFEGLLVRHAEIESMVFFPRALEIEKQLSANQE